MRYSYMIVRLKPWRGWTFTAQAHIMRKRAIFIRKNKEWVAIQKAKAAVKAFSLMPVLPLWSWSLGLHCREPGCQCFPRWFDKYESEHSMYLLHANTHLELKTSWKTTSSIGLCFPIASSFLGLCWAHWSSELLSCLQVFWNIGSQT